MMKIINFFIIIFFILSCNEDYSKKQIDIPSTITNWNINDEPPSIELCDQFDSELKRSTCFQETLLKLVYKNIDISEVIVEKNLNDTLVISLLIDKNGKISYNSSIINSDIKKYIPSIETILIKAIKNLPNILPATKTNIGVPVSSSFDLPLILKTK